MTKSISNSRHSSLNNKKNVDHSTTYLQLQSHSGTRLPETYQSTQYNGHFIHSHPIQNLFWDCYPTAVANCNYHSTTSQAAAVDRLIRRPNCEQPTRVQLSLVPIYESLGRTSGQNYKIQISMIIMLTSNWNDKKTA